MTTRRLHVAGLAAALVAVFAAPAAALHRESPPSIRITTGPPHVLPRTRSWGNFLAFPSTADLLGTGTTGRHIYSWNLAYFDCNRGTTKKTTPCPNPPRPDLVEVTEDARGGSPDSGSITANGFFVTFDADGSYGGAGGAQAHRRQIFLLDRVKNVLTQVTQSGAGDSTQATVNHSGGLIVFESTAPLLGLHGPAGMRQIFAYSIISGKLVQITAGSGPSSAPMPNAGEIIAFQSTADLLGDGHDTGVSQIFVATLDKDTFEPEVTQITKGNAPSQRPFISENKAGSRIVFESTATDLPGSTPGPGTTIYSAPASQGSFPSIRQQSAPTWGSCTWPTVDATVSHISFICTGDPLQNGTTGNRIFVLDTTIAPPANGTFPLPIQLTGRGNAQGPLSHNLGQFFEAYSDTGDVSDTGACGAQIQVIDYYTVQPGHWHGAVAIGEKPPDLQDNPNTDPSPFPPPATNDLGTHMFDILPASSAGGSFLEFTTRDGTVVSPISAGHVEVFFTPYAINGEGTVTVPAASAFVPPILIPNFGTMCLEMSDDGEGAVDCDGGRSGGDLLVTQDHDTRFSPDPLVADPTCQIGCAEDNASCQDGVLGPHKQPCPTCPGGQIALCNGPIRVNRGGSLSAGGLQVFLPVRVRISVNAGVDKRFCTPDDQYEFRQLGGSLELTTETAQGLVEDADATTGSEVESTPLTGVPLSCTALQHRQTTSLQMNGTVPVLDVPIPIVQNALRDVILGVHLDLRSHPLDPRAETPGNQCRPGICHSNAECDDGNPCNGVETCDNFACQPGVSLCDDGDPCNGVETCNPTTGACGAGTPPDCSDTDLCTFDTCLTGVGCVHVNPCDDGNACNGAETCDHQTGACGPGTPLVCNDGNPCTTDACDPQFGCTFVNNSSSCTDGNPCTSGDVCTNGACTGTPVNFSDNNVCNGLETCNPLTGALVPGAPLSCNDNNPCTDDSCDPVNGCQHAANANSCDDGSVCTVGDTCGPDGKCAGVPVVICPDDGNPCNGPESCNPLTGACQSGPPLTCDDNNPCTDDSCVAGIGCTHVPNTAPCNDGNACTDPDVCAAGTCTGTPVACSDGNICNGVETCNPANPTTFKCVPGKPLDCNDNDPCTTDTCNGLLGCQHFPVGGPCATNLILHQRVMPLISLMQVQPRGSVGGDAMQQRLARLLHQVEMRLKDAGRSKSLAPRKLALIQRRLRSFIALVDTSRQAGKTTADLADQLIGGAAQALDDLAKVKAPA